MFSIFFLLPAKLDVLHVHEGKMVAVCVGFSCPENSSWVIYVVRDLATAASLYVALDQAAPQR